MIYFDSDYTEGAHPEVMRRLVETNLEHTGWLWLRPLYTTSQRSYRADIAFV